MVRVRDEPDDSAVAGYGDGVEAARVAGRQGWAARGGLGGRSRSFEWEMGGGSCGF